MDVIAVAKELGMGLISHDMYQRYRNAEVALENDGNLQKKIVDFNSFAEQNRSVTGDDADAANVKISEMYAEIMENPNMAEFAEAKNAFETLLNNVYATINHFVNPNAGGGCAGSCAGCSGCGTE